MSLQEGWRGLKTRILCQQGFEAGEFGEAVTQAQEESPLPMCLQLSPDLSAVLELPTLIVISVKKVKIKICNGQQSKVSTAVQSNNNIY